MGLLYLYKYTTYFGKANHLQVNILGLVNNVFL